jgi:hypothetical protein
MKERGLVDMRDPAVRAAKCLSCHLGNPDEGKFVTHDMYAAGHPPLPGFEIENFLYAIPPHWKPQAVQPKELQKKYGFDEKEKFAKTRYMFIGGLVALREYARLSAHCTGRAESSSGGSGGGIELAVYDCQSCHHELTLDSWRQTPGYRPRPGLPAQRSWPLVVGQPSVLAKVALAVTAAEQRPEVKAKVLQEFDAAAKKLQAVNEAVTIRPFGDAKKVQETAQDLAEQLRVLIDRLNSTHFSDKFAAALALEICRAGNDTLDFESQRQLAWVFKIILEDEPGLLPDHETANTAWATLQENLSLEIPRRAGSEDHRGVGPSVSQALHAAARYNPGSVTKAWRILANGLSKSAP